MKMFTTCVSQYKNWETLPFYWMIMMIFLNMFEVNEFGTESVTFIEFDSYFQTVKICYQCIRGSVFSSFAVDD